MTAAAVTETRASLRAVAAVLALTFTALGGLLFTTQTAAYAFSPGVLPVTLPPSIAAPLTNTILPAAGTAGAAVLGTAATGLAVGGAVGTAAVCLFTNLPCALPGWGQAPNVPVNNDQQATGGTYGYDTTQTTACPNGGSTSTRVYSGGGANPADNLIASTVTDSSCTGVYGYLKAPGMAGELWAARMNVPGGAGLSAYQNNCDGLGTRCTEFVIARSGERTEASILTRWDLTTEGVIGTGTAPDPLRFAQAWRECGTLSTSSATFLRAVAQAVQYRESMATGARPEMPVPACPASHPVPFRYGVGTTTGTPLAPGSYPDTQAMPSPARGVPASPYPSPTTYPECPYPGTCPVGRPTPGGTPLLPLPSPANPDGSPATNPDGTPRTEPVPKPGPGDLPCAWGPYAVPEANCTGPGSVGAPQGEPTTANETGTDPSPAPQSDPDGCLSRSVSWNPVTWVLGPVKCALQWAFVPSTATTATLTQLKTNATSRAPMVWATEAGGWVVTVLGGPSGTSGGCLVYDVDLASLGSYHIINSCANEPVPNAIRPWRPLLLVAVYASFLGPLAWWAWRSFAPLARPQG